MPRLVLIPIVLLLTLAPSSRAQQPLGMPDPETTGRYYMLAFPDTTATGLDVDDMLPQKDTFLVLIYSAVPNRAVFDGPGGYHREIPMEGGRFTKVFLNDSLHPAPRVVCDVIGQASRDVFTLRTDEPVIVYCVMYTRFGGEGWTPIPVEDWGREYWPVTAPGACVEDLVPSTTRPGVYTTELKRAPACLLLISAYDGTEIEIDGPGSIGYRKVTLDAGSCYQLETEGETPTQLWELQEDLSGTRVIATAPIGVLAVTQRAWFRDTLPRDPYKTFNGIQGMMVEWVPPTISYSTEYTCIAPDVSTTLPAGYGTAKHSRTTARIVGPLPTQITVVGDSGQVDTGELPPGTPHDILMIPGRMVTVRASNLFTTTCLTSAGFLGAYALDWAIGLSAASVEAIGRSSWSSFAPVAGYYEPRVPRGLLVRKPPFHYDGFCTDSVRHWIFIITDTTFMNSVFWDDSQPFVFDGGAVPGTDLVWGRAEIQNGEERWLSGQNGARFGAILYNATVGVADDDASIARKLSKYWESVGTTVMYPLAPRRGRLASTEFPSDVFITDEARITVFPNPSSGPTSLYFTAPSSGPAEFEVFNNLGERVYGQRLAWIDSGAGSWYWNGSGVSSGTYVVRISGADWNVVGRLIVNREERQ